MNTQDMHATFSRNDTNLVIFDRIDDLEGQYGAFRVPAPAGAAPAPPAPAPAPAVLAAIPIQTGIILARVNRIDEDVHAFVRDVQVGEETLVVNPILNAEDESDEEAVLDDADDGIDEADLEDAEAHADARGVQLGLQETPRVNPTSLVSITPDCQVEAVREEVQCTSDQVNILDHIRNTPGIDTMFTATIGPFDVAPPQPANTVISSTTPTVISTLERLVEAAMEVVNRPETAGRALEKADGESVGEPALKRQAMEKDPRCMRHPSIKPDPLEHRHRNVEDNDEDTGTSEFFNNREE